MVQNHAKYWAQAHQQKHLKKSLLNNSKSMRRLILRTLPVALLFIGGITYALFQGQDLIIGPRISIIYPPNGMVATTSLLTLTGHVKNVAFITLNDRPIYTDSKGTIKESLLLPRGYTMMVIQAKDRFGKTTEKRLELYYQGTD
jgi:hypothetical protein